MRANFQKSYLMRYLMFVGVCLPLSLWFFYDGFIGYPSQLPQTRAFDPLRELEPKERLDQWKEIAKKNGWSTTEPEKTTKELESDIIGQYIFGGLTALVASIALVYFFRSRNTWVERTAAGLTTSWGQTVDFAKVAQIDKKKWQNKGLARVTYFEQGKKMHFVFDDFKYDREPLDRMLYEMEQTLRPEQIVGGPPEDVPMQTQPADSVEHAATDIASDLPNTVAPSSTGTPYSSP